MNKETQEITLGLKAIEEKMSNIFGTIYTDKGFIFAPLQDNKTKVNNIQRAKDYLNTHVSLYLMEIVFIGGISQEYKTALKIKVIK